MEKWKVAAIGALLLSIPAYAALSSRSANTAPVNGAPTETPTPNPALVALMGTQPQPWNVAAPLWANTSRPLTPQDLKGKVTLLEFWRIGCSHCEDAVPFMNALKKRYGTKLQIITFQSPGAIDDPENPENSWPKVKAWMKERNVSYPVAFDEGRAIKNQYSIKLYPHVLLVGRDGNIAYTHTGHTPVKEQILAAEIEKLVAQS